MLKSINPNIGPDAGKWYQCQETDLQLKLQEAHKTMTYSEIVEALYHERTLGHPLKGPLEGMSSASSYTFLEIMNAIVSLSFNDGWEARTHCINNQAREIHSSEIQGRKSEY